jgi:hypothetical protein
VRYPPTIVQFAPFLKTNQKGPKRLHWVGLRLPSEVGWVYAFQAGSLKHLHNGDGYPNLSAPVDMPKIQRMGCTR